MTPAWRPRVTRRAVARALLIVGTVGIVLTAGRSLPRDNQLHFRLPESTLPACRLQFAWQGIEDPDHFGGGSMTVPNNRSRVMESTVRAPIGAYRLTVVILRPREKGSCSSELATLPMRDQTIQLEGGDAQIHLSPADNP